MGLITKEVEVGLGGKNIKYYENLGYKIPKYKNENGKMVVKRGEKIKVSVNHLSNGSQVLVEYKCDKCNQIFKTRYDDYLKHNKNGKMYCLCCVGKRCLTKEYTKNINEEDNKRRFRLYKSSNNYWNRPITENYNLFIKKVLKRDNYLCQCCSCSSNLEVHHLDGYNWCVEKRTDETNGITLCHECHANFHSRYGRGDNTKEQFEEWIGRAMNDLEKYNGTLPTARKIYCIEEDIIYDNAQQIMDKWHLKGNKEIYKMCSHYGNVKSIKNKHLLWLDEYENMTLKDIELYLESCKRKKI
ncbi:MAG: HNH endonuclease [Lachnospiraceae bacterium]|nr:HNH endonuclease [Lachnospiraceae bacterium]